jgi:hypothetical protein
VLEILTGSIPWLLIIFLFVGGYFIPEVIAAFVLTFNIYWFYRSITMSVNAIAGYLNIRATEKTEWLEKLKTDPRTKDWEKIFHAVLVCNVREPLSTLRRTINAIANQEIAKTQIVLILAMEEREVEAKEKARVLIREYKGKFHKMIATFHPLVDGETIGKHSNEAYAAKQVKKILVEKNKIPLDNIIVTTSDADSIFPRQYFALLSYQFLTVKEPHLKFFQAPQFPFNNINKVPLLVRIMELPSGISQLAGLKKYSKRYFVVSTYSTSLKLLDRIGYWDLDFIPEDWHVNIKAYFSLGGKVEIIPLFLVISIDAAQADSTWKTYQNRYHQVKRQAWGAIDVPYTIKQFFLHQEIPLPDRISKLSFVLESHLLWSINWLVLTIGANIPLILNPAFATTTLGFNLSRFSGIILTMCLPGMIAIIFITNMLDPNKEKKLLAFLHPLTYLQWVFLPVAGLFLNALPGLESQTRLMFGKYIEYRVTEKV